MASASYISDHNHDQSGIMVGVQFDEGVVLAINMISNLIYYLDDHIFCCASKSGFNHEALLDTASTLGNMSQNVSDFKGPTVNQALELLSKKYENVKDTELLLAGQDSSGMHLVTLKSFGAHTRVSFAALGIGADIALDFLKKEWKNGMNLKQAEMLARNAIAIGSRNITELDICFLFKKDKFK